MENKLNFKKIRDINITSYNIVVEETIGNITSKYILENVINSLTTQPTITKKILENNTEQIWNFPNDIFLDTYNNYSIKIYVDNIELNLSQFTVSDILFKIYVLYPLNINNKIEIEYYKDEITYYHTTNNSCKYFVYPVIKDSHNMGDHNILK